MGWRRDRCQRRRDKEGGSEEGFTHPRSVSVFLETHNALTPRSWGRATGSRHALTQSPARRLLNL
ncbi:hypothetical protein BOSEA31B_20726 [Hyphomicrobiales bacterium]|nr:hypothetical protein BOSEA31B_20726 [Hyphomicrobiales bacterium]CAH1702777.1 hypothetical protein BOSEA1005_30649 [Hyphomicrobiales bacterium]CAI0346967.1 hypothetical protein BO1005MUT1_530143 [Hyphomicrobiales bacterium]